MKAIRGLVKRTIRREGRIGRVWRRRGTRAWKHGWVEGVLRRTRLMRDGSEEGSKDAARVRL
jgi:hypothetical protein